MEKLYKCTLSVLGLCQMVYNGNLRKSFVPFNGINRESDDIILTNEQIQQIISMKHDKNDNSVKALARFSKILSDMTDEALKILQLDAPSVEDEFDLEL